MSCATSVSELKRCVSCMSEVQNHLSHLSCLFPPSQSANHKFLVFILGRMGVKGIANMDLLVYGVGLRLESDVLSDGKVAEVGRRRMNSDLGGKWTTRNPKCMIIATDAGYHKNVITLALKLMTLKL
ncbi:hypothetical protein Tco_0922166 [Tanacetum coccineum]|uniref:Uncharacterized protein n=1 Tax=Tanacetum coccineum TaxID=301880 RepID=A0ABQ5CZ01_9ASTR